MLGGGLERTIVLCCISNRRLDTKHISHAFNRHIPGREEREPSLPAGSSSDRWATNPALRWPGRHRLPISASGGRGRKEGLKGASRQHKLNLNFECEWALEQRSALGTARRAEAGLGCGMGFSWHVRLPSSASGPCRGEKKQKDPDVQR